MRIRFWAAVLGVALTVGAARGEDWQRKAVELYPQLGVSGSEFNTKYWNLYRQRKQTNPSYFNIPQWPVLLAKECSVQLGAQTAAKTPPPPPAAAAPASGASSSEPPEMIVGRKLLVAKCGRCHDPPNPRVEEAMWNRWLWKWRGRAQLTDDEYDQLSTYAKRLRESPRPVAPANAQESPEMAAGRQLFQTKCLGCHDVPSPTRVDPAKWQEWMIKMRGKAHLTDAEFDQIMDYARMKRAAYMEKAH